jgi:acetyl esterase/lipase
MLLSITNVYKRFLIAVLFFVSSAQFVSAQQLTTYRSEVIYGRKDGLAMTMVVLTSPDAKSNSRGIINVMSGGWYSSYVWLDRAIDDSKPFLERGYTVFCVMHGSQPRYTIPDAVADLHRAVRFIRYHAAEYKINGDKLGITGSSAGGHLSLMMGTEDVADTTSKDPVDRVLGKVQAIACFFPPTDFLNYGFPGGNILSAKPQLAAHGFLAPFLFTQWDSANKYYPIITDTATQNKIAWQVSPLYKASADDAPTFIIHGDADKTVPLQQSKIFIAKLKATGVPCELQVKPGADHGWENMNAERNRFADWFDKYLK